MFGGSGVDTINGGNGSDWIFGGGGADVLSGGNGGPANSNADRFAFMSVLDGGDTITDFNIAEGDKFVLDAEGFGLVAGATVAFSTGSEGLGSSGGLVYKSGQLYWDANGSVSGGQTLLATVTGSPSLTAAQIEVIDFNGATTTTDWVLSI
jgi:Ca2+-binding RTX toxin-like protein